MPALPWAWALLALAALGGANALYFVLVTYRLVRPDAPWLPRVCRMDEATCARVVDTPAARVLGAPNALLGLGWYAVVAAAAALALAAGAVPLCGALLPAAVLTVALGAYLAWVLLARLRVPCALCFLGHGINLAILGALAAACA